MTDPVEFTIYTCPKCEAKIPNVAIYKDAHVDRCPGSLEERIRRVAATDQARAALTDTSVPRVWWWLTFSDPDRPAGERFLGAVMLDAPVEAGAVMLRAWELDANPGGQVIIVGPVNGEAVDARVPEAYRRRLLTSREDLKAVGVDFTEED